MLILKFTRIASSIILAKFKQVFIKIYINQDAIFSGPTSGNIQVTDSYTGVGGVIWTQPMGHRTFPWTREALFLEPQLPEFQKVTWSLGR